jgi:ferredoxin
MTRQAISLDKKILTDSRRPATALRRRLLTPSRLESETAGNEPERDGTRRSEIAVKARFYLVKAGVRVPLAPLIAHVRWDGNVPPERIEAVHKAQKLCPEDAVSLTDE